MAKRYEMAWDCPRCDTPKLLGLTHRHCPNCGSPQDPTRRYYPKEEDKVAVEDHPFAGADKACPGCDTPNAAAAHFCVNCGGPLDGAKAVDKRSAQAAKSPSAFGEDSSKDAAADLARQKAPPPPPPKKSSAPLLGVVAVLALIVVCCGVFGIFAFWKKEAGVTVDHHAWVRTVAIERYDTVTDSAWRDQVPAGARDVSCTQAERSKTKVADGQECHTKREDHGDGTFTEKEECKPKYREEPVYDEKCRYTTEQWRKVRDEKLAGNAVSDTPRWPTVTLAGSGTSLGAEREAGRTEVYTVHFKDSDGRALSCDMAEAKWSALPGGSRWTAPVGVLSDSIDCTALAPAR